ncbi:MAG TPA: hypothetical protein VJC06_01565 [Candidatus Paceibacterota bacterium]
MKHFFETLEKYIDFHFALALIAIFGTAGSLYLQLDEANSEFDALNASTYSVVRSRSNDARENSTLNSELDELGKSLDDLKL